MTLKVLSEKSCEVKVTNVGESMGFPTPIPFHSVRKPLILLMLQFALVLAM
jgi:hypothetical protein